MFLPSNHASDLVCIKATPSQPSFHLGMKTAASVPTSASSLPQTGIWRPWNYPQDEVQTSPLSHRCLWNDSFQNEGIEAIF